LKKRTSSGIVPISAGLIKQEVKS